MRLLPNKPWNSPPATALLVLLFAGGAGAYVIHLEAQAFQAREHARVVGRLQIVRAALERELSRDTDTLNAFDALVQAKPDIREADFEAICAALSRDLPAMREVQLSPGGVVRFVYPPTAADAVRGLDLKTLPGQKDVVLESIHDGKTRLAGPMPLVQGGMGLVARDPIYTGTGKRRRFWGFATVVLDYPTFIHNIPALEDDPDVEYAIRGKDGLGAEGDVFYGPAAVFNGRAETADVALPTGHWQVAGQPKGGWHSAPAYGAITRTLIIVSIILTSVLAYVIRRRGLAMEHLATRDQLTGAWRRHTFTERAEAELKRAARYGRPLSLLWFDLDHFKRVNDNWGHATGDSALRSVVRRVMETLRPSDILSRVGGEEFAVLCPETDLEQAAALAERLRESVARLRMRFGNTEESLTVSVGVVDFKESRKTLTAMMSAADQALYRAKHGGRNRVCIG